MMLSSMDEAERNTLDLNIWHSAFQSAWPSQMMLLFIALSLLYNYSNSYSLSYPPSYL